MKNKEKRKKSIFKRWWFWLIAIFIVIGALGSEGDNTNNESSTDASTNNVVVDSQEKEQETNKEEKEEIYNIGDSFNSGNIGVVIESVEEKTVFESGNQFIDNVTTEGKFVAVTAKLTNNDKEARTFSSTQFQLIDEQGRKFEALSSASLMMILGDKNLFLESCNPGMSRTGIFVFEVPSDVNSYSIEVASGVGFAAGKTAKVKLK